MEYLFGIIFFALVYFYVEAEHAKKLNKESYDNEVKKNFILRRSPQLNINYNKAKNICEKLVEQHGRSAMTSSLQNNFKINNDTFCNISARGYINSNVHLITIWSISYESLQLNITLKNISNPELNIEFQKRYLTDYAEEDILKNILSQIIE